MNKKPRARVEAKVRKIMTLIEEMSNIDVRISEGDWHKIYTTVDCALGNARDRLTQDTSNTFKL